MVGRQHPTVKKHPSMTTDLWRERRGRRGDGVHRECCHPVSCTRKEVGRWRELISYGECCWETDVAGATCTYVGVAGVFGDGL